MKLGIVSAIYDGFTFEEAVENAVQNGCECMEVACWPQGKAERRYAGVSHIDVDNMSPEYTAYIKDFCAKKGIEISSLAFYPNTMDGDLQKREANIAHLKKVINMSALLGVNMVTTFIGRDQTKTVEENLEYLNPPVKTVFADFVSRIRLIDPDLEAALEELKGKIENDVFMEWVDALKSCLYDRSLKTTLTPIVAKLSDMRIVNAELEYLVFEPRKEFITMVVLAVGNIPLLYFLNQSWYDTLMHTIPGQIMLAVTGAIIFVSTACVIKLTKPIEYRT